MMVTPGGHSRLELSQFLIPHTATDHRTAPVNSLGYLRVMFKVDNLDELLSRLIKHGAEVVSGRGPITTEERQLSNFTGVIANGSTNTYITQNSSSEVMLKAYSNLLTYLETKIYGHNLSIGYRKNTNIRNDNSEIYIKMPELTIIVTNGSGDVSVTGNFISVDFKASTSGSGDITLPMGTVDNLSIEVAGSGNVKGFYFMSNNASVTIEGSGNVEVYAAEKLNVKINGSGNVYYK